MNQPLPNYNCALTPVQFAEYAKPFLRWSMQRPMALGNLCVRLFTPSDRRRIVQWPDGIRLFLDPASLIGWHIAMGRTFETETVTHLRSILRPGGTFLDIGANEGAISAHAVKIVGPSGKVVSVEPQTRLLDVLRINQLLNGPCDNRVIPYAVGEATGTTKPFKLYPPQNSGASGFYRVARSGHGEIDVPFISPDDLWELADMKIVDLVKIDVEGYEHRVIDALLPQLTAGKIRHLLVDYHSAVLKRVGVDPANIERKILESGMKAIAPINARLDGYRLYLISSKS